MPIVAIFHGVGIAREQYELLRREIGWEKQHPAGGMIHIASFDANGDTRVVDVWESQQTLDVFVREKLTPTMQQHRIPAPKVDIYHVHNLNVYRAIENYILK